MLFKFSSWRGIVADEMENGETITKIKPIQTNEKTL